MVENVLAQVYKEKDEETGFYRGGPAYYIRRGLGEKWRWLGALFSITLILSFGFVFNTIQSNSMAEAMEHAFGLNPMLVGVVVGQRDCDGRREIHR